MTESPHFRAIAWLSLNGLTKVLVQGQSDPYITSQVPHYTFGRRKDQMGDALWSVAEQGETKVFDKSAQWLCTYACGETRFLHKGIGAQPKGVECCWAIQWAPVADTTIVEAVAVGAHLKDCVQMHHAKKLLYLGALETGVGIFDVLCDLLHLVQMASCSPKDSGLSITVLTKQTQAVHSVSSECLFGWQHAAVATLARTAICERNVSVQCIDHTSWSHNWTLRSNEAHVCLASRNIDNRSQLTGQRLVRSTVQPVATPLAETSVLSRQVNLTSVSNCKANIACLNRLHALEIHEVELSMDAAEILARGYFRKALMSVPKAEVLHDHHHKLWARWQQRLQSDHVREIAIDYAECCTRFPDLLCSYRLIARFVAKNCCCFESTDHMKLTVAVEGVAKLLKAF